MSIQKDSKILAIEGNEGTKIKQYFHPHNTFDGIRFSLAQFSVKPSRRSLRHKLQSSEVYYILEAQNAMRRVRRVPRE